MIQARNKCSEHVSEYWAEFTRIYGLDRIEGRESSYREFTKWLQSDKGLLNFLDTFGSLPLTGRTNALITFRSMVEISLLMRQMTSLTFAPDLLLLEYSANSKSHVREAYRELGELAARHQKFRNLDLALFDVNVPLLDHMEKEARRELMERLTPALGRAVASKLSSIPIVDGKDESKYPASLATGLLHPDSFTVAGTQLVIGPERVTIETVYPNQIRSEWKEHCQLDVWTPERIRRIFKRRES